MRQHALLPALLACCVLAVANPNVLHAQDTPASTQEPSREDQLRAEIARLEAEAARLRQELEARRSAPAPAPGRASASSLPATRPSTFATTRPAASLPAPKAPGSPRPVLDASTPATQPAPAVPKTYSSAQEILRDLPADLRPGATPAGWDRFTSSRVRDWFGKEVVGRRFETPLPLALAWVVGEDSDPKTRLYWVNFSFSNSEFKYAGKPVTQKIEPFTLTRDEAFTRRATRLKEGTPLRVGGTIRAISLNPALPDGYTFTIHLRDATVTSAHLEP